MQLHDRVSLYQVTILTTLALILTYVSPAHSQAKPAKTYVNSLGMEFILIPAGSFQMGSESGDPDEKPVRKITLSKDYYLGKTEVTQAQWQAVMETNPSLFKGDPNRPVEQVWWDDAQAFIKKLNEMEGGSAYRLPTEAEWEYAARAGSTTAFSFGDDKSLLGQYAWYKDTASNQTHPVAQLKPNPWGLYDMHGNVWEWVSDWYGRYSAGAATDPTGPSAGTHRGRRGGGWNNLDHYCRSANRYSVTGYRDDFLGFRLVRTLP